MILKKNFEDKNDKKLLLERIQLDQPKRDDLQDSSTPSKLVETDQEILKEAPIGKDDKLEKKEVLQLK